MAARWAHRRLGAVLLTAMLAAGCGDSVDEADQTADDVPGEATSADATAGTDSDATEDTAGRSTEDGAAEGGDAEAAAADFCEAAPAVDRALQEEEPDPAAVEQALTAAEASAPVELQEQVAVAVDAVRGTLEGGDFFALMSDVGVSGAMAAINEYLVDACGFTALDITAVDYEFQGLSETIAPGEVALNLENGGQELHEAVVVRLNDDTTESIQELLELPQEEAMSKATNVGFAIAFPSLTGSTTMELDAGRYAVICFLPVGATPEAFAEAMATGEEPQGPPHFTQGMVAEFTVE